MNAIKLLEFAVISLAALCLAPLACLAQGSQENLYEVVSVVVKPGMTAKFEEGIKEVHAYSEKHGNTTGNEAFQVMYGPAGGEIDILIPFEWANEDNPPSYAAGIRRAIEEDVQPYVSSVHMRLVRGLPDVGNPPAANAPPENYYEVINLVIKPARMNDFMAAVEQLSAAERKFNRQSNPVLIYTTVAGGDANHVTVAVGHPNFADFGRQEKSNVEVLTEAYGAQAASAIMDSLEDSVASEDVTIVRYRPDLSYMPSGQGR